MKKINECDSVAPNGGLTFGDVAGMGEIKFPGENPNNGYDGERGSGDLPLPSGRVYTQVAPFGVFKKMGWEKRKRKKKSPYHTPNPPMYNYVDDYLDYVERTYKQMDKMKK